MEWLIVIGVILAVAIFIYRAGSESRADKIKADTAVQERKRRKESQRVHDEMANADNDILRRNLK